MGKLNVVPKTWTGLNRTLTSLAPYQFYMSRFESFGQQILGHPRDYRIDGALSGLEWILGWSPRHWASTAKRIFRAIEVVVWLQAGLSTRSDHWPRRQSNDLVMTMSATSMQNNTLKVIHDAQRSGSDSHPLAIYLDPVANHQYCTNSPRTGPLTWIIKQ